MLAFVLALLVMTYHYVYFKLVAGVQLLYLERMVFQYPRSWILHAY